MLISKVFRLSGGREGFTGPLGDYYFRDGQTLVQATDGEMPGLITFLRRRWGAEVADDEEADKILRIGFEAFGNPAKAGEPSGDGEGTTDPEGDSGGSSTDGNRPPDKLTAAVKSLDPNDDTHWTAKGLPAIEAVSKAYGKSNLTRADIEAAAPGYTRPKA